MSFQSIEEKIIYEKLTADIALDLYDSKGTELSYQQGCESSDGLDTRHLQSLMDKVIGYIDVQEQTRINTSFRAVSPGKRKIMAGLVIFVKRIIRRLTRWYVEPVCQQQTAFNNAVTPAFGRITEINHAMIHHLIALFRTQKQTYASQQETNNQINLLREKLEASINKIMEMERSFEAQTMTSEALQKAQIAEMETFHNAQMAEMEASHKAQVAKMEASYKSLAEVQSLGNQELIKLQTRMDRLNKLDLAIFDENYIDAWEKDAYGVGTFAQCGEDMMVAFLLRAMGLSLDDVSYVDLGANHAKKLSNTYHFYRHGARGVLVEANPALIPELKFYRNGDVILNRCVSERSGDTVDFYVMGNSYESGDGLSTSNKDSAYLFTKINPKLAIYDTVRVETVSVNDVVENYMGKIPTLLNIDIEGNELAILKSIDFTKIRPFVILIEMVPYTMPFAITERDRDILEFLNNNGYLEYAFTGVNSVFLDKSQLQGRVMIK